MGAQGSKTAATTATKVASASKQQMVKAAIQDAAPLLQQQTAAKAAVDMDAVIKRDNELLSKLSTLDMTVKPTSELLTAGNKDVKLRPSKSAQALGTFTQEQLRDFFVFGKKPKAMDDETAALLKKHLAAYTIMEGDNQLFGVWPSPATPSPSSSRQANQAQGL